jgi:DNA repair protein RadA/Sms
LPGEGRPVPRGQERIQEAKKHGFTKVIVPHGNRPPKQDSNIEVVLIKKLSELFDHVF